MVYGILEILTIKLVPVEMNHMGFLRGRGMKKLDCSFVELSQMVILNNVKINSFFHSVYETVKLEE